MSLWYIWRLKKTVYEGQTHYATEKKPTIKSAEIYGLLALTVPGLHASGDVRAVDSHKVDVRHIKAERKRRNAESGT